MSFTEKLNITSGYLLNMNILKIKKTSILCAILSFILIEIVTAQNKVFYAGGSGKERFLNIVQLSDKTFLIAGTSTNLDWIPQTVSKRELQASNIVTASANNIGFLMQISEDLNTILNVVNFPLGTVRDITRIKTTNLPGNKTGEMFISGRRDVADYTKDGYFIAKLNNNFVDGVPDNIVWSIDVSCKPSQASGYKNESAYKTIQPWDVGSDGKVTYGGGSEFDFSWAEIKRTNSSGINEVVENWRAHWSSTEEWDGFPATSYTKPNPLVYSAIVLKAGRAGSLRSTTMAEYNLLQNDENGNSGRKGTFPDDYYFSGPCDFAGTCLGGPGYTGYKISGKPTQRLGDIVIDRRTNEFYFGYSTQTILPDGLPDFEPAVVAMDKTGKLKWWARLYKETSSNSTPDQYVDRLGIDYSANKLVVLGRSHGNNVINLWKGNELVANPGGSGFQNQFSGSNGNIHVSWLGKLNLNDGKVTNSTYMGELIEGTNNTGAASTDPNLDGWPSPNGGWPNLNTTKAKFNMAISSNGLVCVLASGRKALTTKEAYQKMVKPGSKGLSTWSNFARVYDSKLSTALYSTILTGKWDTITGNGGDNIELEGIVKTDKGIVVVGYSKVDISDNVLGAIMPVTSAPAWGKVTPVSEDGIIARFMASNIASTEVVLGNAAEDSKNELLVYPNPANTELNIQGLNSGILNGSIEIKNILSNTVYYDKGFSDNSLQINISKLNEGIYFIILKNENHSQIRKILIKR